MIAVVVTLFLIATSAALAQPAETNYFIETVAGSDPPEEVANDSPTGGFPIGPGDVVVDWRGTVYFSSLADQILKVTPDGRLEAVAGIAFERGSTGDGGPATEALLANPKGVAVDEFRNLYFADSQNHKIRKIDAKGMITTVAGTGERGFSGDGGPAVEAQLAEPGGLAVDEAGNLYIADRFSRRVRKVTPDGVIDTVAGGGQSGDGSLAVEASVAPSDVAVDRAGNLYIAEPANYRVTKVGPDGILTTIAGTGEEGFSGDGGPATEAQLRPGALALDRVGNLYVADTPANRIRKVDAAGIITTFAGAGDIGPTRQFGGDGGPATEALLALPNGLAVDEVGNVYIADISGPTGHVWKVGTDGIIQVVAGYLETEEEPAPEDNGDDGQATEATLSFPLDVAIGNQGDFYIADVAVRKVDPSGVITTFAGGGESTADGIPATEARVMASGVAVDTSGRVYIASDGWKVRLVDSAGLITTVAGRGVRPVFEREFLRDSAVPATEVDIPASDAVVDPAGRFYVSGSTRVGRVDLDGIMSSVWEGLFKFAQQLALDGSGNLFVVESLDFFSILRPQGGGNVGHQVRRVDASGEAEVIAGTGQAGFTGDGGPAAQAALAFPYGVAADDRGNVFISDTGNHRIRRVSPDGVITTIAGTGEQGFGGDGGPALAAKLAFPAGMSVDRDGNIYFADNQNRRVRRLRPLLPGTPLFGPSNIVNTASGLPGLPLAPDSWMSVYGVELADALEEFVPPELPQTLGGVSVRIMDSSGAVHTGRLQVVSGAQINLWAPAGIALGPANLTVIRDEVESVPIPIKIARVAPGLFSANADGQGPAAGQVIRVRDGLQTVLSIAEFSAADGRFVATPHALEPDEQLYLQLFGTGIRGRSDLAAVTAGVGGARVPVFYAGPGGGAPGLDQVNLGPLTLILKQTPGVLDIELFVDGVAANIVQIALF